MCTSTDGGYVLTPGVNHVVKRFHFVHVKLRFIVGLLFLVRVMQHNTRRIETLSSFQAGECCSRKLLRVTAYRPLGTYVGPST